jgi:hypothetical protein
LFKGIYENIEIFNKLLSILNKWKEFYF